MDNKKELTKEEMIAAIMADIIKHDPEHPKRSLESIEKNMRKKDISDLRDDYYFYFPREKEKDLNYEVEDEVPDFFYRIKINDGHLAENERYIQRYDRINGSTQFKVGDIVFTGTYWDCNIITNKLNNGVISETEVSILRDISSYAEYRSAMMRVNGTYPPIRTPLYDVNEITMKLCYRMEINAVPYTRLNTQKWQETINSPQPREIINSLDSKKIARMEDMLAQLYPDYFRVVDIVYGYDVRDSVIFENNQGFVLADNPKAPFPFASWQFTETENGEREYSQGHYFIDKDLVAIDYETRVSKYRTTHNLAEKDTSKIPIGGKNMDNDAPKPKQEYSKEEIKQAENVDIQGFLTSSYPDQVTVKGNQLLFKNTKEETVSINISDSDKNGLFFNTATQNSGKGIINFLRQETGMNFKNAVGALLAFSQKEPPAPELTQAQNDLIASANERRLNIECGQAIDQALKDTYTPGEMAGTGRYDSRAAVKSVVEKHGVERVMLVLAANINAAQHDGRISAQNKAWARSLNAPDKPDFYLDSHLTVVELFANKFRETIPQGYEQETQIERSVFASPDWAETTNNVVNYLTGKLSIDKGIVKSCIENGAIYQTDVYSEKLGKKLACAVFAGYDNDGVMQSAVIKGFGSYEKVAEGSQLKHAFVLPAKETKGKQATTISVFDNPIETLAGATLAKMKNKTNYANIHRLSVVKTWLISTHAKALRTFLENNPQVQTVNLCLPNTESGHKIAESIQYMLKELSKQRGEAIKVNNLIPQDTKDFQEQLQNKLGEIKENRKAKETIE